jgi:hypothetical protein
VVLERLKRRVAAMSFIAKIICMLDKDVFVRRAESLA